MYLRTTIPLVVFLARASAQFHRIEFSDAANCPATADMPKCAVDCIDKAAASNGCASPDDLVCQCKNYAKIQKAAEPCVIAACATKAPAVASVASEICSQCAGIPVAAARTRNGENYFQWAAEPTGRVAPRRDWKRESADDQLKAWEEAERKKWLTMPIPIAAVAAETGRPVPREVLGGEMPQAEMEKGKMAESENLRLNPRESPELPDFGSDKSPELPDFGGEPSELTSLNKECTLKGSGSLKSCDDLPDWDRGNFVKGDKLEALARTRSNTMKRDVDLVYEQEQERWRQLRDKEDLRQMRDKEDLRQMRDKEDLRQMRDKEDLRQMRDKEDLRQMRDKEDLRQMKGKEGSEMKMVMDKDSEQRQ
ncbi:hypothetical protein QBC40DRAFT_299756 [Triangularia verruculosa]|uniref:CFEM domain-containing protein n=1 Tax=Triangularia verruculosa TaxID=2587418 RepID=A0AAN7ATJ5_9PEZI|nr:hypothetical protein QBC40DRAFT_299756 [Triangularia verruculosa]